MEDSILWLDVETSGLDARFHELLEIGAMLTDFKGQLLAEPYSTLIAKPNLSRVIEESSREAFEMHQKNNLWLELWDACTVQSLHEASEGLTGLLDQAPPGLIHPGGTSLYLDLAFVRIEFPDVTERLSHQVMDTSSLKLMAEHSRATPPFMREGLHRALPDAEDALNEYRYYLNE